MIIDQGVLFWLIVVFFVRNPRRANAKELRRAYERARQELKTIELEARPKGDRKLDPTPSSRRRYGGNVGRA